MLDIVYSTWTPRTKAWVNTFTVLFLLVYLVLLLNGGFSSTQYALEYGERSYSSWRPYMAPIKIIARIGITLMLLQAVAVLLKDIATLRGGGSLPGRPLMSYEMIAILMFASMMLMLITGQRVFAAIGSVAVIAALFLWGEGGERNGLLGRDEAHEVVSAAHPPDVHLHGLHALGVGHRGRPLPDVPRVVRAGARRARHRHHRGDGGGLGDERPQRRRHGHRGDHRVAGAAPPGLRQDYGDRGHPDRKLARDPGPAERGAGPLRDDCAPAGRPALAGRGHPRPDDGGPVLPKAERTVKFGEKLKLLQAGILPFPSSSP